MARRILIVDEVAANRILRRARLNAACYCVDMARSGEEALAMARETPPDLVLMDLGEGAPGKGDPGGNAACAAFKADPDLAPVPVVMLCPTVEAILDALGAGADDALVKPVDERVLMARIRNLLRARERITGATRQNLESIGFSESPAGFEGPARITLIAQRPELALRWRGLIGPHLRGTISTLRWDDALDTERPVPDLYILSEMVDSDRTGLQLLADLRSHPGTCDAAICLVLPPGASDEIAIALDLGADDVLHDGFGGLEAACRARALIRRKRQQDRHREHLAEGLRLAVTDPLTGLHNRRYALPTLERMIADSAPAGHCGAIMVLDIDHFKAVNDRHGHAAGDAVLVEVARRLSARLRPGDLIARIGGEEFLIALPGIDASAARRMAEELRHAVSARPIPVPGQAEGLRVTASIGLALTGGGNGRADRLIERADRALLSAKAEGRDQVALVDGAFG